MSYNATEHHTRVMYDLLTKEGEKLTDNEDDSTVGVNTNQQAVPADRSAHTIDAPWGEPDVPKSEHATAEHFSDAAMEGFIQGRQTMLDELFDSKKPAGDAEKKLVSERFNLGRSGEYESKAILLEKKAEDRTLSERTRGLLD